MRHGCIRAMVAAVFIVAAQAAYAGDGLELEGVPDLPRIQDESVMFNLTGDVNFSILTTSPQAYPTESPQTLEWRVNKLPIRVHRWTKYAGEKFDINSTVRMLEDYARTKTQVRVTLKHPCLQFSDEGRLIGLEADRIDLPDVPVYDISIPDPSSGANL